MINNLNDYPSLFLDNSEYAMIPMKSGIDLKDEMAKDNYRSADETYVEQENYTMDDFQDDTEEVDKFYDEEYYLNESMNRGEKAFEPVFGVPLFIEERYMDDEDGYRGKKHKCKKYNMNPQCIYMNIQRCHPQIFRILRRYGMPCSEAKKMIMRIVTLTMMYGEI